MLKLVEFPGQSGDDIFVQRITHDSSLIKTAGRGALHPSISTRIAELSADKDPNKMHILVNALGAGEFYGPNANGDYFEEKYLSKHASGYGHSTFKSGGVYRHHRNKDINKSMGHVDTAIWNPRMRRVELIVCVLRDRAKELGHSSLVTALDNDEHPAVSMGCKVKYDVCSICAHRSKTRSDYCSHARNMMGQVMPDGRRVYVYNPFPKFFDISFVLVGADKISFAMSKFASGSATLSAELAFEAGLVDPDAQEGKVAALKTSQISKQIEGVAEKIVPDLESRGKDLSPNTIKNLSKAPLSEALSATTAAGIVLRPSEYQELVLLKAGMSTLASDLRARNVVFAESEKVDRSLELGVPVSEKIAAVAAGSMRTRSCFLPFMSTRVLLGSEPKHKMATRKQNNSPILETISAGYNGYRVEVLEKLGTTLNEVTKVSPSMIREIAKASLEDRLTGFEKGATYGAAALPLLGVVPLAYLYSAYVRKRKVAGEEVSMVDSFIERHPMFSASMAQGLARLGVALKESGHIDQGVSALLRKVL